MGGQGAGPPQNQMWVSHRPQMSHRPPYMMQGGLMRIRGNTNNQQAGSSGVSWVNMCKMQGHSQQDPPSQLMSKHQWIVSSQGQKVHQLVNLNPQNPKILFSAPLMPRGQMMVNPQGQILGSLPQKITPPKQMFPHQDSQIMVHIIRKWGLRGKVYSRRTQ